ncbi:hypothetical protein NBRC111894_299 [Sporolactobacillus inulinus]|uniref:Uncharacterized protein n=1 Tax=Sporolactobacillus inulinus TaxID=2078 RepID=A0A4Y1Z6T4_9BACL|nr:hypothetical protein NBRC111894_299 [Sporolactobacillus inulinus]
MLLFFDQLPLNAAFDKVRTLEKMMRYAAFSNQHSRFLANCVRHGLRMCPSFNCGTSARIRKTGQKAPGPYFRLPPSIQALFITLCTKGTPAARLPRAHREPPQTDKNLRGLAGTLFPQASRAFVPPQDAVTSALRKGRTFTGCDNFRVAYRTYAHLAEVPLFSGSSLTTSESSFIISRSSTFMRLSSYTKAKS